MSEGNGTITTRTAAELGDLLRRGEVSATEVVQAHLDRIAQTDGEVGAFLHVMADDALGQAAYIARRRASGEQLGALAGVPLALKDLLCTRGVPTTCGSRILEGYHPPYDAGVVERLREAGVITIGKTNMDEFAMGSSTENSAFQVTRNPWDLDRVPGGSSGGSVAAVASFQAPLAIGTDTGGSIRQPASLCGLVGVKPTYGAVSRYGLIAFASSLDQAGPIARTVTDAAELLAVIAGPDPRDSTSIPKPMPDVLAGLEDGIDGLRVGVVTDYMDDGMGPGGMADGVRARVNDAVERLASLGAEIVEVGLPHAEYGLPAYYLIAPAEASSNLARYDGVRYGLRVPGRDIVDMYEKTRAAGFGREVKRRIMIGTYVLSAGYYDAYYVQAQKVRTLIKRDFEEVFADGVDAILTPATPSAAFGIADQDMAADPVKMYLNDIFTVTVNMAGLPGIAVPAGLDARGLPLGLQLIGRPFDEETLFSTAEVIEQAAGRMKLPDPWW